MLKSVLVLFVSVGYGFGSMPVSPYATSVVGYTAGSGHSPGLDNPATALGEPSRVTPGMFGGPVDPFTPPYLASQLVSVGVGGSLTISFAQPVVNDGHNAFGVDFLIFGNNGFTITNGDFNGGGVTDGTTFTFDPPGSSRVFVSSDNISFYELAVPIGWQGVVDGLFPTDGLGNFQVPVDPTLSGSDFSGLDLAGIRARYAGSAGGTGFDLAWAQNAQGQPVLLPEARYIRIEVMSGRLEVDGFAVVPEPSVWGLALMGAVGWWWIKRSRASAPTVGVDVRRLCSPETTSGLWPDEDSRLVTSSPTSR